MTAFLAATLLLCTPWIQVSLADDVGSSLVLQSSYQIIARAEGLIDEGRHREAIEFIEHALEQRPELDQVDRARLLVRLAYPLNRLGEFDRVPEVIEAAQSLVLDDEDPQAFSVYVDTLSALSSYFSSTRQLREALEASLDELAARRQLPIEESKLDVALINVANANHLLGHFGAAEAHLLEALEFARRHRSNPRRLSTIYINLGAVYSQRKEHVQALRFWRRAIEAKREQAPGSLSLATALANSANALRSLGLYDDAETALAEALAIQRRQRPDSTDTGRTLYALGQIAESRSELARAERLYRETISIQDANLPDSPDAAFSRRALGGLMIDLMRYDEAELLLGEAEALTSPINNPGYHAATLFQLGRLALVRGDSETARNRWFAAIEALETQYDLLGGSSLALGGFSQAYESLYRNLAQLLIDSGDYAEAIRVLERYRNRALLERIDSDRILRRRAGGQEQNHDLIEFQDPEDGSSDPRSLAEATAAGPAGRLAEHRQRRRELVAQAIGSDPTLGQLFYSSSDWELNDLAVDSSTRLLYYSLGEKRGDLLLVGPQGMRSYRLPPAREISTLVERFRILVQRPDLDPAPLLEVSRTLYDVLIGPVQSDLGEARTLLIRTDGALSLLPFAALLDQNDHYLVEHFALERLNTLFGGRSNATANSINDLAYSGFAYSGAERDPAELRSLRGPLRHAEAEVDIVSALFGSRAERFIGATATETRARDVKGRRVLHFASHAVANPVEPLRSYVSLAADDHNDGQLELWEIMTELSLDGGLVVLTGCETALGPNFAGEGLFGLAAGFAYAGAESVIASLWSIDDASTRHLTEMLFREMAAGQSEADALSRAQRALMTGEITAENWWQRWLGIGSVDHYRHPYYWASLTLTRMR